MLSVTQEILAIPVFAFTRRESGSEPALKAVSRGTQIIQTVFDTVLRSPKAKWNRKIRTVLILIEAIKER